MKILRIAVLAGLLCPLPAASARQSAKRAFEIADYYRTAFVGAPAAGPDGSRIAFAVRRYDLEKGQSWSEIWTMSPDGSKQQRVTDGKHGDVSPVFSPDGKTLLFVSDRDGSDELYVMPAEGGEARKLTDFSMGVADPRWSPDGKWIAVTSEVYPECGADSGCNERIRKGIGQGELQVHVADSLLYRHWSSWRDGAYAHILLVDAANGKVVRDLTPGYWDSPTFSLSGDRGYDFSPDSRELCYVSNHGSYPESSTNSDLWVVPVGTEKGDSVDITAANPGWDGSPLYSPDGRWIAFRSQATDGYESALFHLALFDRETRKIRYLTDEVNFDNRVDEIAWTRDSKALYFQGEFQGRNPLYRTALDSRAVEPVLEDGTIGGWLLLPGDGAIVYNRRTTGAPPEIYRASAEGVKPVRLTRFNAALEREVDIRPAEEMWVPGAGDYRVHLFVVKPHDFDPAQKYPLILNVHGGPQSQWMDSYRGDWQVYPGKGYVVAFANPTGSTGYGQPFTDAIGGDWGGRVFQDLMKVTDYLERLPYVDSERMGSMGWSYGGYMMMWFEGQTHRFRASASMMGIYDLTSMFGATEELWFPQWDLGGAPWSSDLYRRWSPSEHVRNFKTPCLVITGEKDFRVPYTQSLQFFTALQKMGVPSRLIVYRNACHWPNWYEMAFYYNAHLDWFHRWLGGGAAPYDMKKFARNDVFASKTGEPPEK